MDQIAPVRCWDKGGDRVVLALHCSLAHAGAFSGLSRGLTGVQLLAMDQAGHGRARDWDGVEDLHRRTFDEAVALAQAAGGTVDLIGHSFGGTVALRIALDRPDLVRSLTLIEPVIFAAAAEAGDPAYARFLANHLPFEALVHAGKAAEAAAVFHGFWGAGEPLAEVADRARDYIIQRIHLIAAQHPFIIDDVAGLLRPGGLEGLRLPVLLLEGAESPPVIAAIQARLAARIPGARRVVVEGARHMLPITHASAVAAEVKRLLDTSA